MTRPSLSRFWQRWNPLARLLLGGIAVALGFWGFTLQEAPRSAVAWVNTAFRTLQLLTLQFPRDIQTVPWPLNVARFLLPTLAALETVRLLAGSVMRPVRLALLGVASRPVLVSVGPGGAGTDVLRQLGEMGHARAALTAGLPADGAALLDAGGVPSLELDPADPEAWHRLHADRARLVVIAHGDDIANLNAAAAAATVLQAARRRPGLLVLLERTGIADGVEAALDLHRAPGAVRPRRLSLVDESVRRLFLDPVPVLLRPGRPAHVAILGWGPAGPSVLRHALTLGQDTPGAVPRITVHADPSATAGDLLLQPGAVPGFLAELSVLPWDEAGPLPHPPPDGVTLWCVCRPDEPGLETALHLLRERPGEHVAVHQSRRSAFLPALAAGTGGQLRVFGGILPDGAMRRILADSDDALPRRMHDTYVEGLRRAGAATGSTGNWGALTEALRDSNRAGARHIPVKLAAAGVTPAAAARPGFAFTPEQVEALARLEHRRWCAERVVQGWRFAPVTDRAARVHRDLVQFEALDEEAREKDRDAVRAIPGLLAGVPASSL